MDSRQWTVDRKKTVGIETSPVRCQLPTVNYLFVFLFPLVLLLSSCPRLAPKNGMRVDSRGDDIKAYIASELDPARDEWQKPNEVVDALLIEQGSTVADIGAGAGYFTFKLADAAGSEGKVYAVESNPELLTFLVQKATEGGYANVKALETKPLEPALPFQSIDFVFVCNNMSRVDMLYTYFDHIRRGMKTGARLAIIDWKKDSPIGPPPDLRRDPKEVQRALESLGFRLIKEYDFLSHQYFMMFVLEERYG